MLIWGGCVKAFGVLALLGLTAKFPFFIRFVRQSLVLLTQIRGINSMRYNKKVVYGTDRTQL